MGEKGIKDEVKTVIIPASVEYIGNGAFDGCSALENVIFKKNSQLKKFGQYAFANCKSLKEITVPKFVGILSRFLFLNCEKMERLDFEEGSELHLIDTGCCKNCKKLNNLKFPEPEVIRQFSFENCESLDTMNELINATNIDPKSFVNTKLKSAKVGKSTVVHEGAFDPSVTVYRGMAQEKAVASGF